MCIMSQQFRVFGNESLTFEHFHCSAHFGSILFDHGFNHLPKIPFTNDILKFDVLPFQNRVGQGLGVGLWSPSQRKSPRVELQDGLFSLYGVIEKGLEFNRVEKYLDYLN